MAFQVIVFDDSPLVRDLTVHALGNAALQSAGAGDLATLHDLLELGEPELLLVDVALPEGSGDEIVVALRSARRLSCSMVLYSDLPEGELKARAERCGANGYICKSWGIEAVVLKVQEHLSRPAHPHRQVKASPTPHSAAPPPASPPPAPAVGSPARARGQRVLVVDDSEMTAKIIEAELSSKGFEVLLADSVEKATRLIVKKTTRPALVLLDLHMPGVDGAQLCRFIKGNDLFRDVKVVLCSSEDPENLKRIVEETGADGYVHKDQFLGKWVQDQLE